MQERQRAEDLEERNRMVQEEEMRRKQSESTRVRELAVWNERDSEEAEEGGDADG